MGIEFGDSGRWWLLLHWCPVPENRWNAWRSHYYAGISWRRFHFELGIPKRLGERLRAAYSKEAQPK